MSRQQRGLGIAAAGKLLQVSATIWKVPAQSRGGFYVVDTAKQSCTCPDYEDNSAKCKHIYAVELFCSGAVQAACGTAVPDPPQKKTYRQDWPAYNLAQTTEKRTVERLLAGLCEGVVQPAQLQGRRRLLLRDVIYGAAMKVYSTVSGRRATTDIQECEEKGFIEHAPHYNSVFAYLGRAELTPLLKRLIEESCAPLKAVETEFAVDGTGFTTSTFHRWYDHRHGRQGLTRKWIKAHAMVGVRTNVVVSIEVTEGHVHDSPQFADLVTSTAERFQVARVSADAAYISHRNLAAVEAVGAVPYIPFKANSTAGGSEAWERLWHLFWYKRREFEQHYHQRSNVESTFSAIKRKFGSSVRSKKYVAQVNEVLCKVLCHNLAVLVHEMHELGVEPVFGNVPASGEVQQ